MLGAYLTHLSWVHITSAHDPDCQAYLKVTKIRRKNFWDRQSWLEPRTLRNRNLWIKLNYQFYARKKTSTMLFWIQIHYFIFVNVFLIGSLLFTTFVIPQILFLSFDWPIRFTFLLLHFSRYLRMQSLDIFLHSVNLNWLLLEHLFSSFNAVFLRIQ